MENQLKIIEPKALMAKIGWFPHPGQQEIIDAYLSGKRKIVVSCGQRWGKSMAAAFICCMELMADNKAVLIIAPSYSLTDRCFEFVKKWMGDFFGQQVEYVSKPVPRLTMPWGSYVEGKSAEAKEQLLGKSYDLIIADESARIPRDVFTSFLFPRLGEKKGAILMISTPFKKDHFYEQFLIAKDDNAAFQFPTATNPNYPKESIEQIRKQIPKAVFEREFMGVFTEELTSIYPNARELISTSLPRERIPGRFHYIGLDLGRDVDFSAITVIDSQTNEVIYVERWNKIPYTAQESKVIGIVNRFKPCKLIIDARNVGAVLGEELRQSGIVVEDWISTGTISKDLTKKGSKQQLVEKSIALFESHSISLPEHQDLLDELSCYTYEISPSGNISYSAPQGLHDDLVSSLQMACWNLFLKEERRGQQIDYEKWMRRNQEVAKQSLHYPELGI